jgi:hypothetical protein
VCKWFLDQPRRIVVSFPDKRILKERSEVKLAVHLAVTANVLLIDKSLVAGSVVKPDEIAGESIALDRAIRTSNHWEFRLFANGASRRITVPKSDNNVLAREELALELIVHPVDCCNRSLVKL